MTKLDTSNDASMEDILASIRKIIAEHPPGSRPATPAAAIAAPAAASTAAAPLSTQGFAPLGQPAFAERAAPLSDPGAFMSRESFIKSSAPRAVPAEPAIQAPAATEPYLRSEPQKSTLSRAAEAFSFGGGASAKVDPVLPMPSARDAAIGDFIPKSRPADPFLDRLASAPAAPMPASAPAQAPAVTLDAQLTELLGGTLPSARPAAVAAAADEVPVPAQISGAAGAEPGFIASRVTFGAEAAASVSAMPAAAPAAAAPAEADPFSFDIGPSPFAARAPVEPAPVAAPAAAPVPAAVSTMPEPEAVAEPAPVAAHTPAYEPAPVMRYIAPSVSATVAPTAPASLIAAPVAPALEPVAASAEAQPVVSVSPAPAAPAVEEAVWTPVADVAKVAVPAVAASVASSATALAAHNTISAEAPEAAQSSALDAAFEKMGGGRSVEDTVADLLRPMLKTWLAENMPRIIERALRRELLDARTPDHKSAAE